MDVKPEEVLALGDAENDIEMLQLAGIGVAMGNAHEKLKAVADYVVATNDEDGVAEAVERFALKKDEPKPASPEASAETEAEIAVITATDVLKSEAGSTAPAAETSTTDIPSTTTPSGS
jgi:magnesium-transporting ATPase (P-type)